MARPAGESSTESPTTVEIGPNPGKQEQFLASPADIAIFGGGAGGGKTFACLFEPLRHIDVPRFSAVILRETREEIRQEGGMWEEAMDLYPQFGGRPRENAMDFTFPIEDRRPATVAFDGIQYEKDLQAYQGGQIPLIIFDQLEHFTERKFFYMLSRNRSTCGVRPYIRATCNPVPRMDKVGGWLNRLVSWWMDPETGYPIQERSGVLRWVARQQGALVWGDSCEEILAKFPKAKPKSLTFVPALLADNPKMAEKDPDYESNLALQTIVDEERLRFGNWKITPAAGLYFKRSWCKTVNAIEVPDQGRIEWVRGWDLAATAPEEGKEPAWTVGVRMGRYPNGRYIVAHVNQLQDDPYGVRKEIRNTASNDGSDVAISVPQDPGQAGKDQVAEYVKMLAGYNVKATPESGDKVTRFGGFSAQARAGNVDILRGEWNDDYFAALETFPEGGLDHGDATSRAFQALTQTDTAGIDFLRNMIESNQRREASGNEADRRPKPPM